MLAAFRFETIVSITEGSSSRGTARLTKRFKASPPESEMRGARSEGRFVSSGAGGGGRPLSSNESLSIPPESTNADGATSSTKSGFSSEFGVGAGGRYSLDRLSNSR